MPISGLNIIKTFLIETIKRDQDERTEDIYVARIPGLMLGPVRVIPCDPCTDEPLPYYTGRTPQPGIISCHQSDYPHMPHHVASDQGPVIAPVIQSNHFTPEQHFDASEDY